MMSKRVQATSYPAWLSLDWVVFRTSLAEMNLICWGLFLVLLLAPAAFFVGGRILAGPQYFHTNAVDFVYFYGVGTLAHAPGGGLYDFATQRQVFNQLCPQPPWFYGPSPYPPFVALFFSSFTRLTFNQAYLLWAAISFFLYTSGTVLAARAMGLRKAGQAGLFLCFALAYCPFFIDTLLNGQLSSTAVFAVGVALALERRGLLFLSGCSLALLCYKPTLLLLIVPMLLVTRRFKSIGGFVTGSLVLAAATTGFLGVNIWPVYLRFLTGFRQQTGDHGPLLLNLSKYIDYSSFSRAIPGGRSPVGLAVLLCLVLLILAVWAFLLWKSASANGSAGALGWAATLTWTLLVNLYVPLYDTSLAPLSVLLTIGALCEPEWRISRRWVIVLALIIYTAAWKTESIAAAHGIQMLTILLTVLGVVQLRLLRRAIFPPAVLAAVAPNQAVTEV